MRLCRPPDTLVRAAQEQEQRFFYSAAFDVVLKKYGLILSDVAPASAVSASEFGFVTRITPWQDTFGSLPLVFEGPLATTVLSKLGIAANSFADERLDTHNHQGQYLGTLCFNRALLRRIPADRLENSDPFPFIAHDARWTPEKFTFQAFEPSESEECVLFGTDTSGVRYCIGIRRGPHLLFGAPLFDTMVQHHVMPPYPVSFYAFVKSSDLEPLERWLLREADVLFRKHHRVSAAIDRWPASKHACLTIRHDFDRTLDGNSPKHRRQRTDIKRLLDCYATRGIKSTWFWRVTTYDEELIAQVIAAGHEIALHTEALNLDQWIDQEVGFFQERVGRPIKGYTVHGGNGAPGYLGQHQIGWALASGMRYGEILCQYVTLPTLAVIIESGIPAASSLVLPAQHRSFDLTTRPEDHRLESMLPESAAALAAGQHCVVMNHPDIHVDQMIAFVAKSNLQGVWRASMAEVASWSLARGTVYRHDGEKSLSLTWAEPLPYTAALSIGYRDAIYRAVIPERSVALEVSVADERPALFLREGDSRRLPIAVSPREKLSVP
ncbi:MAG: hypothetical protein ACREX3_02875 [Gammaproteobacteria bacterium]